MKRGEDDKVGRRIMQSKWNQKNSRVNSFYKSSKILDQIVILFSAYKIRFAPLLRGNETGFDGVRYEIHTHNVCAIYTVARSIMSKRRKYGSETNPHSNLEMHRIRITLNLESKTFRREECSKEIRNCIFSILRS